MIPLPSVEDMEELRLEARLQFYEAEELTEEQVKRFVDSFKYIKDSFDETVTGSHTGVI